jgi:hypothetical protein
VETNKRQKTLLVFAVIGLALFIGDTALFEPLLAAWKERGERIVALQHQVDDGTKMLKREYSLRNNWESKRTNALPSDQSVAESELFKAFDRWERASGITRVSIKPQWKEGDSETYNYMTLECRADYNGDMERVKRFLYEMEKDPIGLKVENVEISSRDDTGQQLSLGLQVSGLQLNPAASSQQP